MRGFKLVVIGFILIVIGGLTIALAPLASTPVEKSSGNKTTNISGGWGGCVIIWFIPICFGSGTSGLAGWIIILSLTLSIILIILFIVFLKASARTMV